MLLCVGFSHFSVVLKPKPTHYANLFPGHRWITQGSIFITIFNHRLWDRRKHGQHGSRHMSVNQGSILITIFNHRLWDRRKHGQHGSRHMSVNQGSIFITIFNHRLWDRRKHGQHGSRHMSVNQGSILITIFNHKCGPRFVVIWWFSTWNVPPGDGRKNGQWHIRDSSYRESLLDWVDPGVGQADQHDFERQESGGGHCGLPLHTQGVRLCLLWLVGAGWHCG